ncbi:MAG: tetratricopeptide repeat protein [Verrucomicrobiota bacterium]|nr:tetratricopeptide repeat protein [Verrucomicrobiota bacterium]
MARWIIHCGLLLFTVGVVSVGRTGAAEVPEIQTGRDSGSITFSKEIAPIIWKNCSPCHRPGQAGPFNLLTFDDVKRRARQVAEVTQQRLMPPWMPDPAVVRFKDERLLSDGEISAIQRWVKNGAPEGNPADLPPPPSWPEGWFLGEPNLVVSLAEPYVLKADGKDIYRNFVLPIPLERKRYVRGIEFRPGNSRVVHHAFLYLDETSQSRRLLTKQSIAESNMELAPSAKMPEGQFVTFQPGKLPSFSPPGLSWALNKGTDLVIQAHLNPSGKEELVQPSVGLYFTDEPPTNTPVKCFLTSLIIDIPAGESNHVVTESFVLPVDASVLGILPHAHYLGREIRSEAILPDGKAIPLLLIRDWNIKWQGEYRYQEPIKLPKGSTLRMRFVYDNSTNRIQNPHRPPRRVTYGPQTTDEMAQLTFQLLVDSAADRRLLAQASGLKMQEKLWEWSDHDLRKDPNLPRANLTRAQLLQGNGKAREAAPFFRKAIEGQPNYPEAHFGLGSVLLVQQDWKGAEESLLRAVQQDPEDHRIHSSLAVAQVNLGKILEAVNHLETALRLNPDDPTSQRLLQQIHDALVKQRAKKAGSSK